MHLAAPRHPAQTAQELTSSASATYGLISAAFILKRPVRDPSCSSLIPHNRMVTQHLADGRAMRQRSQFLGRSRLEPLSVLDDRQTVLHAAPFKTRRRATAQQTRHGSRGRRAAATGYHAIQFLLWGQDLNGHGDGAGDRSWTDFAQGDACTNGNCDRRAEYLATATDLLVSDLEWMAMQWTEGREARANVMADDQAGLSAILTGMGSLSYGETAGERMRLHLMLSDPEEEQSCLADNTHNAHNYDGMGRQNVYLGEYLRIDGTLVSGPSLADFVAADNPDLDAEMRKRLIETMMALGRIKTAAEAGFAYDEMLARGNEAGERLIMGGVDALIAQTRSIERVLADLGLGGIAFEGSDSLDNPSAVFQ